MRIISIVNHKGGVGKTMTVHNLGSALAIKKKRVLLIDFDPQENLSNHCKVDAENNRTISDYLNDDDISVCPVELNKYLHIIPAGETLDQDSINMSAMDNPTDAINLLRNILSRVGGNYDICLIDCAPGSGLLMLNSLCAATEIIVPVYDKDALKGAKKIGDLIRCNGFTTDVRYLTTRYNKSIGIHKELREYMEEECPDLLYRTIIRQCEDLNQAACNEVDIFEYAPKSNGADDYMSLAREVIGRGKKQNIL